MRQKIEVTGIVQGVGFRPFVFRLATELGLGGFVLNHEAGVSIELQGERAPLQEFVTRLQAEAPAAARIDSFEVETVVDGDIEPVSDRVSAQFFEIRESLSRGIGGRHPAGISPDLALCEACRREIWDPSDRRYFYPFTNCTLCGPRYSIIRDIPYDRATTTMSAFQMCEPCQAEYDNPADRRFHAQPNACPECGPKIFLNKGDGSPLASGDAKAILEAAAALLRQGRIIAVKGIGGYHLACDAFNLEAVQTLRHRKIRERKPFAVMFPTLESCHEQVILTAEEVHLLQSSAAPIVLAKKRENTRIVPEVAPGNLYLGCMLPYTPLHELLLKTLDRPLVMTSGNRSDEPIVFSDAEAFARLSTIADVFLLHNREIFLRCEDSVVAEGVLLRRSRGFAPQTLRLTGESFQFNVLAAGGDLKNTIGLAKKGGLEVLLSQHFGDLANPLALEAFEKGVLHLKRLFDFEPEIVAHDLHPHYFSTRWSQGLGDSNKRRVFGVQHHHAHVASVMAEHGLIAPVIGVALDGTGFGTDGTIWGGEILVADRRDFIRVAHLWPLKLPPGEKPLKKPWMLALAFLREAFGAGYWEQAKDLECFRREAPKEVALLRSLLERDLRTYISTSTGRLFDAVAAITGASSEVCFEGQAAIELEAAAEREEGLSVGSSGATDFYRFGTVGRMLDWRPVVRQIILDLQKGVAASRISLRFHNGLVEGVLGAVARLSRQYEMSDIVFSGGTLLNRRLRMGFKSGVEEKGLQFFSNVSVPPGDGGLALGQVVIAERMSKGEQSCVWQFR